jgi:putative sigma-54 modulation protein
MQLSISGRHMEMTEGLKDHVGVRLDKLRGHFESVIDANVVLSVEKHRHIAEITLHANGLHLHGKEVSSDMYVSVDACVDKLDKQAQKHKKRIQRAAQRNHRDNDYGHNIIEIDDAEAQEENGATGREHRVILREKLGMKPMNVEEAALQLELTEDSFLVFSNSDTQQVNVLYARDDGTFGLIEPQF